MQLGISTHVLRHHECDILGEYYQFVSSFTGLERIRSPSGNVVGWNESHRSIVINVLIQRAEV